MMARRAALVGLGLRSAATAWLLAACVGDDTAQPADATCEMSLHASGGVLTARVAVACARGAVQAEVAAWHAVEGPIGRAQAIEIPCGTTGEAGWGFQLDGKGYVHAVAVLAGGAICAIEL